MGGVSFAKKTVENGGVFFVKKWTFPQRRVHYAQYQYFLFYILLIWGGVRTHLRTHTDTLVQSCLWVHFV